MNPYPIKLGVPYAVFGLPLCYMLVTRQEYQPWVIAFGVYFIASIMTMASYEGFAYRVSFVVLWWRSLENLCAAFIVAVISALILTGNLDGLFAAAKQH